MYNLDERAKKDYAGLYVLAIQEEEGMKKCLLFFAVSAVQAQTALTVGSSVHGSTNLGYEQGLSPGLFLRLRQPFGKSCEVRALGEATLEKKFFLPDGYKWRQRTEALYKVSPHFGILGASYLAQQRNSHYTKLALNFGAGPWVTTGPGKFEVSMSLLTLAPDLVSYNKIRGFYWQGELEQEIKNGLGWFLEVGVERIWFRSSPGAGKLGSGSSFMLRLGPTFSFRQRQEH